MANRPPTSLPSPDAVRYELIESDEGLHSAAQHWKTVKVVALDTEFVRERTYYPALGLVQVAAADRIYLIDPQADLDLSPLRELLVDAAILKVLHSCSEDLEVFALHVDTLPEPLFDTQVAAALVGRGYSPGYARLIDDLFGVVVPKGETRSNWLARPLRKAQLHYAALDVFYLLPAQQQLAAELQALGRDGWMLEESRRQLENARREPEDSDLYLKIGRARHMSSGQLTALRDLLVWREEEARKRDLPRNFVIKEAPLIQLALRRPRGFERLREIDGLDRKTAERHGRALLRVLRRAKERAPSERPPELPEITDLSSHKGEVSALRALIKQCAEQLEIAPELLANRRTIEHLKRRSLDGTEPLLPRALRGWRAEVVGSALEDLLARQSR